jgi:PEP-CTERM motif
MKVPILTFLVAATQCDAAVYTQNFSGIADGFGTIPNTSAEITAPNHSYLLSTGEVLNTINQMAFRGSAITIQGETLRLAANNTSSTRGTFQIPNSATSGAESGWTATFNFSLNPGTSAGDGFSFSFGDIPFGAGNFGDENGWNETNRNHIAFSFRTFYEGPETDPALSIIANNGSGQTVLTRVGSLNDPPLQTPNFNAVPGTASISWSPTTGASFTTTGLNRNINVTNISTNGSYVPSSSHSFAFSARSGGSSQDTLIDNIRIVTIPEPSSALLLGLGGIALLRRRR